MCSGAAIDGTFALNHRLEAARIRAALIIGAAMIIQIVPNVAQTALLIVEEQLGRLVRQQAAPLTNQTADGIVEQVQ